MAGAAGGPIQQAVGQIPKYMQPYMNNMIPQQPGLVKAGQGGFGQGTPFQMPIPEGYQSPYSSYGFDSGLQSYLDNQYLRSMTDAGTNFQYDPNTQMFNGATMSGRYNPIPLNIMQQAASGNQSVLSPYFQSKYPQPTGPVPTVKPGTPQFPLQPSVNVDPKRPPSFLGPRAGVPQTPQPQRGPADRNIQPVVTQGLAGLMQGRK